MYALRAFCAHLYMGGDHGRGKHLFSCPRSALQASLLEEGDWLTHLFSQHLPVPGGE